MKEFSKSYCIRESSCHISSLATLSYKYVFSNNRQNVVIAPHVIYYSKVSYFPSDPMYTPEMRVTTKYKVM